MLSKIFDKIFLALCGAALLIRLLLEPSLNRFGSFGRENISDLSNTLVLFVIAFLFILKKILLKESIRCPKILWILGSFCLTASLTISYSVDGPSTLLFSLDLWASFFFIFVLINFLNSIKLIELMAGILIMLTVIVNVFAVYDYLVTLPKLLAFMPNTIPYADRGIRELLSTHRIPTLFGWPNILAGFLVMTIPLMFIFLVTKRPVVIRICIVLALILALYTFFITNTVSSWVGIFAGLMVVFLAIKKFSLSHRGWIGILFTVIFTTVLIAYIFHQKMNLPNGNSTDARWQYFTSSCALIKLHPIIGSGWRTYGIASFPYIKNTNGSSEYAHNSYLQIWAEVGIIGLVIFLYFLWLLFKNSLELLHERHYQYRWLALTITVGIVGSIVDNLFSYTMIKPQIALFWWVLCALAIALKENSTIAPPQLKNQMLIKKIFLLITLAGGILTFRLALAEYYFFSAVDDIHHGIQYDRAVKLCLKARDLNPWDKKFDLARAFALYGSFTKTLDIPTLLQARDAALSTEGQISLGSERAAILKSINANLAVIDKTQQ